MQIIKQDKQTRARKWVNGYTAVGSGVVIAAIIPGSTSAALCAMEAHMCYQIGKIYLGENYSFKEATSAARAIGLVAVAGKLLALEAMNMLPGLGTLAKAAVAGGVIKALGEAIIRYYEQQHMPRRSEILDAEMVNETLVATPPALPRPFSPDSTERSSVEHRLRRLAELRQCCVISAAEYDSKRQQIISEL